jgi:hypothetical protein
MTAKSKGVKGKVPIIPKSGAGKKIAGKVPVIPKGSRGAKSTDKKG